MNGFTVRDEYWLAHEPCRKEVYMQDHANTACREHLERHHVCDPDKNWNGSAPRWEPANG